MVNHRINQIDSVIGLMNGGFSNIFLAFSFILLFILFIFIIFSNRVYVKNNKKNIGILKMLGFEKKRIYYCYHYSNFIMVSAAIILGIILSLIFISIINLVMISSLSINVIKPNILIFIIVYCFLFGISLITLSLMLKSLSKYDIIDLMNKE